MGLDPGSHRPQNHPYNWGERHDVYIEPGASIKLIKRKRKSRVCSNL